MRSSFDSTYFLQASSEMAPSNSHVHATLSGCPLRSRYRKNVSPQDSELARLASDIVIPLPFPGCGVHSAINSDAPLVTTSSPLLRRAADAITIPRFGLYCCESCHNPAVRLGEGALRSCPRCGRSPTIAQLEHVAGAKPCSVVGLFRVG